MNFDHVNNFLTVAQENNITRAAARLYISQSSLSRSITALEGELGCKLFDRTSKQISLNENGETARDYFLKINGSVENMRKEISSLQRGQTGNVHVGMSFLPSSPLWLEEVISSFVATHTDVNLSMPKMHYNKLTSMLLDLEIDFGVSTYMISSPNIRWIDLYSENFGVLISQDHELAQKESISIQDLKDESCLIGNTNSGLKHIADDFFGRVGIKHKVSFEIDSPGMVGEMVGKGKGFALITENRHLHLSKSTKNDPKLNNVTFRPLSNDFCKCRYGVCYRYNRYIPKAALDLLNSILETFRIDSVSEQSYTTPRLKAIHPENISL